MFCMHFLLVCKFFFSFKDMRRRHTLEITLNFIKNLSCTPEPCFWETRDRRIYFKSKILWSLLYILSGVSSVLKTFFKNMRIRRTIIKSLKWKRMDLIIGDYFYYHCIKICTNTKRKDVELNNLCVLWLNFQFYLLNKKQYEKIR